MTYIGAKLLEALTTSSSSSGGGVTISDTSPSSPSAGDQWFNSSDLKMYIYYADGSSSQWVQSSPTGNITGTTLSSFSVGSEGSASGDGAIAYNNSSGVFTYTPPLIGGSTTVYANTSSLPSVASATTGDMAFVTANTRFYVFNGSAWYSVALTNTAPTVSGASASYTLATDGSATVVTLSASDPEGDPLTYSHTATGLGTEATITQGTGSNTNVFTVTPSTNEAHAGSFSVVFSATDGANVVNNTSSFTLVFSLPLHYSTELLVKTSGTNNQTNKSVFDQSTSTHTLAMYGDVQQTTFSPYLTNSSITMDGNGDYLQFANATQHDRSGVVNWTLEAWVWLDDYSTQSDASGLWYSKYNYPSPAGGIFIGVDVSQGNRTFARVNSNNTQTLVGNYTFPLREWVHVALVRNGNGTNNISLYENGTLQMQISQANTVSNVTVPVDIGRRSSFYPNNTWNGKIHTVRMNNTAVYTTDFTPPTETLTATSDTAFLVGANSGNFNDQSTNAQIPTVNGQCKIDGNSPFIPDPWKTNKGGSAYIAGTGDKLNIPAHSDFVVGTGDFSIECWVYIVSNASNYASIFDFRGSTTRNDASAITLAYSDVTNKMYIYSHPTFHVNNIPRKFHTWQHLVFQRRTIGGTPTAEFYIDGVLFHTASNSTNWSANNGIDIGTSNWSDHGNFYIADFKFNKGSASYSGAFTPPTAPTAIQSDTKLKLNFDQAGVFDSVSKSSLQLKGDAQESTTQTKYATTNIKLNGTGYTTSTDPSLNIRTGDFQVELWSYRTSTTGSEGFFHLSANPIGSSTDGIALYSDSSYNMWLYHNGFTNTGTLAPANQWNHHAVIRRNGRLQAFLNGTRHTDIASTHDFNGSTMNVGQMYTTGNTFTGYIEDFRYLQHHTTYPNERPQTALTAVSGTTLQLANSSTIPSSPNGLSLSVGAGSPTVSAFTPPDSTVTHSIRYDGNDRTDIASNTNLQFGTGDFTVEMYLYLVSQATNYASVIDFRSSSTQNDASSFTLVYSASKMYIYASPTFHVNNIPRVLNKWQHLVYQRRTISGTQYDEFYIDGVLFHQATDSTNWTGNSMWIGSSHWGDHGDFYIADLRVNKGNAIYSSTFTPPSSAL